MDGVVLTEQGLKAIRSSLQKTQTKRSTNKQKNSKSNEETGSRAGEVSENALFDIICNNILIANYW